MGCCVLAAVLAGAPRIAFLLWWFLAPGRINAAFDSFMWPLLGVIFLPWTVLTYVFVAPNGLSIINWIFLVIALLADLGAWGGGARGRRT